MILDTAGYIKVWHYPTQQCVFTFDEKERQPLTLDFNCNYSRLYVAGKTYFWKLFFHIFFVLNIGSDCVINCYDFVTKKLISKLQAS